MVLFIIFGLVVAVWFLFVGFLSPDGFSLVVGFSWLIILGANLFKKLRNWARIIAIILSAIVLLVCIADFVVGMRVDPFYMIGTIFYAPGILPGIWALFFTKRRGEYKGKGKEEKGKKKGTVPGSGTG